MRVYSHAYTYAHVCVHMRHDTIHHTVLLEKYGAAAKDIKTETRHGEKGIAIIRLAIFGAEKRGHLCTELCASTHTWISSCMYMWDL